MNSKYFKDEDLEAYGTAPGEKMASCPLCGARHEKPVFDVRQARYKEELQKQVKTLREEVKDLKRKKKSLLFDFENPIRGLKLDDAIEYLIRETFKVNGGNIVHTAKSLGIGRATMYRKVEEYKLRTSHGSST